jgi:glycerol-3-phosphate O-acyltransferase
VFVHHFVIPSIIALKLIHGVNTREDLLQHILVFNDLLRYEFMFPRSYNFTEVVDTMLTFSLERGLITEERGLLRIHPEKSRQMEMLANILLPFLESFQVAINVLISKKAVYPMEVKRLITVFRETHHKLLLLGKISFLEGNLTVTYNNIIKFFTDEGIIITEKLSNRKTVIKKGEHFENLSFLEERLFPKEPGSTG